MGRARPDPIRLQGLLEALDVTGYYLFWHEGARARARLFGALGILEDPATGSAAGPLGAYLVEHGAMDPGRLTITQGVELGRPSTLSIDVDRDLRVRVGGGVAIVGRGVFELPWPSSRGTGASARLGVTARCREANAPRSKWTTTRIPAVRGPAGPA